TKNTQKASVYYSASSKGSTDCGNLSPGDEIVMPSMDNKTDVRVVLTISRTGDEDEIIIQDSGL
ncbi:MAG TPA: hypothetical protein VJS88_09220, partial [Chthoniobacterales bacterium]|nr:hypothetical protein [Chthoniobacterales bacterium]